MTQNLACVGALSASCLYVYVGHSVSGQQMDVASMSEFDDIYHS